MNAALIEVLQLASGVEEQLRADALARYKRRLEMHARSATAADRIQGSRAAAKACSMGPITPKGSPGGVHFFHLSSCSQTGASDRCLLVLATATVPEK